MAIIQNRLLSPFDQMAFFSCNADYLGQPESEKPNSIVDLVHDLRWDAMVFAGQHPFLKIPHNKRYTPISQYYKTQI
jgi:hypothetical protein